MPALESVFARLIMFSLVRNIFQHLSFLLIAIFPCFVQAETNDSIALSSGNEISYTAFPANGQQLVLWFYSEAGAQAFDKQIAIELAKRGYETWLIDLFDSYFLPVSLSSMDKIPTADISEFINHAAKQTGKKVFPVTTGRSAIPLLRAKQHGQLNNVAEDILPGMVLISPKFYLQTPDPGTEATLMPIVTYSNSLLFVMQPAKSPWYWKLEQTIPALEKNGSDVFVQRIAGVRDRFYFRPDADDYEKKLSNKLPNYIVRAISALSNFPAKQRQPVIQLSEIKEKTSARKDKKLSPHRGRSKPETLKLNSLNGPVFDLQQLKGKVILVNFWASWCPPCVHEMPSMQRLQDRFGDKDFIILGVNMAEDEQTIEHFLKTKVAVSFPILLDKDGAALKRWQVFAFPTSYVIDKQGKIRFSLFGSIEWDKPHPVEIIQQLINE